MVHLLPARHSPCIPEFTAVGSVSRYAHTHTLANSRQWAENFGFVEPFGIGHHILMGFVEVAWISIYIPFKSAAIQFNSAAILFSAFVRSSVGKTLGVKKLLERVLHNRNACVCVFVCVRIFRVKTTKRSKLDYLIDCKHGTKLERGTRTSKNRKLMRFDDLSLRLQMWTTAKRPNLEGWTSVAHLSRKREMLHLKWSISRCHSIRFKNDGIIDIAVCAHGCWVYHVLQIQLFSNANDQLDTCIQNLQIIFIWKLWRNHEPAIRSNGFFSLKTQKREQNMKSYTSNPSLFCVTYFWSAAHRNNRAYGPFYFIFSIFTEIWWISVQHDTRQTAINAERVLYSNFIFYFLIRNGVSILHSPGAQFALVSPNLNLNKFS